jgi:hypothetical protein
VPGFRVTSHAIDRWSERVLPDCDRTTAERGILVMARDGRRKPNPPKWAREGGTRASAGVFFITWHQRPGIVLVVREGRITTVIDKKGGAPRREQQRMRRHMDRPQKRIRFHDS